MSMFATAAWTMPVLQELFSLVSQANVLSIDASENAAGQLTATALAHLFRCQLLLVRELSGGLTTLRLSKCKLNDKSLYTLVRPLMHRKRTKAEEEHDATMLEKLWKKAKMEDLRDALDVQEGGEGDASMGPMIKQSRLTPLQTGMRKVRRAASRPLSRNFFEFKREGELGLKSFRRQLKRLGIKLTLAEAQACLEHFDRDGNGKVDMQEFLYTFLNKNARYIDPSKKRNKKEGADTQAADHSQKHGTKLHFAVVKDPQQDVVPEAMPLNLAGQSLLVLDLSFNDIGNHGVEKAIAPMLERNKFLMELNLAYNNITLRVHHRGALEEFGATMPRLELEYDC